MFFYRFFDVCNTQGGTNDFHMILVFEYIDQDLAKYMEHCPTPGIDHDTIQVGVYTSTIFIYINLEFLTKFNSSFFVIKIKYFTVGYFFRILFIRYYVV